MLTIFNLLVFKHKQIYSAAEVCGFESFDTITNCYIFNCKPENGMEAQLFRYDIRLQIFISNG